MTLREALAAHLAWFQELGVDGVSRDPWWRARRAAGPPSPERVAEPQATAGPAREPAPDPRREASVYVRHPTAQASAPRQPLVPFEEQPDLLSEPVSARPEARARTRAEALRLIREDLGDCTRCKLHRLGRRQIVYGVGNPEAALMFVGEAPGRDEDLQGEPFVGRAGQLLTRMIEAMGFAREQVYIANVIKCRPPENRNPEPDEIAACQPFLLRQIEAVRPKVIVALGAIALKALLGADTPISRVRGRVIDYRGAKLVPTFHPAFLLRSPDRKREAWEDLKTVLALLRGEA
jgi:uracil-DNA glycosylase family 4